ncbi:MAG: hypothetical protein DRH57_00025 [Candidatus Cloacimonadota bacterium]|nr:MAG: hypothetical protein DRH57_00025 [Candidatus Cloacimonadota bacterium]
MKEIVEDIYNNLKAEFKGRERNDLYFHVSDLPTICPRAVYYSRKTNMPFRKSPVYAKPVMLAYAYGILIQHFFSRYSSYLISKWRCPKCKSVYYLSYRDWNRIPCKHLVQEDYRLELSNKKFKLVGNIDALYKDPTGIYIAEIKSINARQFDDLQEPLFDHVFQVLTYLWMFKRKKVKLDEGLQKFHIRKDKAVVLYFKKDFQNLQIKPFFVDKNEYSIENRIKELLMHLFNPTKDSPKICNSRLSPPARKCVFRSICFKEDKNESKEK